MPISARYKMICSKLKEFTVRPLDGFDRPLVVYLRLSASSKGAYIRKLLTVAANRSNACSIAIHVLAFTRSRIQARAQ